ncbi:MAG: hypothetical protein M3Q65_26600 [Chloroflexota bacterium]|nr:hypothetical protein [Chloroflexota bacterium]
MSMLYEVWDYETGNCLGAYPDEGTALADVRATIQAHGPAAAASLVLLTAPDDGDGTQIAAGAALARLAAAAAPAIPSNVGLAAPRLAGLRQGAKPTGPGGRTTSHRFPTAGRYARRDSAGKWQSRHPRPYKGSKRSPKKD